jgi:hypothetical protein
MSIWVDVRIDCRGCGATFVGRTVNGLNLTRNPDIRDSIMQQRFNLFTCPSCEGAVLLERPFLYTDLDSERLHFLSVKPAGQLPAWRVAERDVADLYHFHIENEPTKLLFTPAHLARFKVRLVYGYEYLREKLLLWDAGLDDRLFEILKMHLLKLRPELVRQGYSRLIVEGLDVPGDTFTVMATRHHGQDALELTCSLEPYEDLVAQRGSLEQSYPDLFRGPFVDLRRYAFPERQVLPSSS